MTWRYLLLAALLGLALADHHEGHGHPRITCNELEVVNDVSFIALNGNWVAVESLFFKDGHPFVPDGDTRPQTCLYARNTATSESAMSIKIESHVDGETETKTETIDVVPVGDSKGRLSGTSDAHDRSNWEFLILDQDPAKYMVYMLCHPPNEAGERLPLRVVLLSRHADHSDHETLSADEELAIEKRVGEKLHLTGHGIQPVKFSHRCWASYAEPAAK